MCISVPLHMCECVYPPVLQHIWPWLQSPSVLSMSSISGPCQTNGSWRLSPGHVPRPLPGPPWLVEPLFLASSEALLSIDGSPLRPRLHSLKTVALGSPRALGGCAKPAAADKPGPPLTAHSLCFLLLFPVLLSVWDGAPQHPSVGTGLWSVGRIQCLSWSFTLAFFFFVVCVFLS